MTSRASTGCWSARAASPPSRRRSTRPPTATPSWSRAGTYDEDLIINIGVTILGAQAGDAGRGRDAATGAGETTIIGHAKVTATGAVTLDGLRFLNDATTTGGGPAQSDAARP